MKPRRLDHQNHSVRQGLPYQRQFFGAGGDPPKPAAPAPPPAPPSASAATAPVRTVIGKAMPRKGRESTNLGAINSQGNKTILGNAFKS